MINDKKLQQEGAEQSTNLQGETIIINNGLSYKDVKEIALDVYRDNSLQLKHEAFETARKRAEEITEDILVKIVNSYPDSLNEFKKPDIQDALFSAQKEYAKSGDKDLGKLLVDVVVNRINSPSRDMIQLLLDEAIRIVPKLTIEQVDVITLNFLLFNTRHSGSETAQSLKNYIINCICPFIDKIPIEYPDANYNYLQHLGCGEMSSAQYTWSLEYVFRKEYRTLFYKGFTIEEFKRFSSHDYNRFEPLLMPCLNNPDKYQLRPEYSNGFKNGIKNNEIDYSEQNQLTTFSEQYRMDDNEIKKFLLSVHPDVAKLYKIWYSVRFRQFKLASVGIVIAHANYTGRTGDAIALSKWIY